MIINVTKRYLEKVKVSLPKAAAGETMQKRKLGNSNLEVSALGFALVFVVALLVRPGRAAEAVLPVGRDDALMPSLLTLSDVMGTGHHAALAARVGPGKSVAVVGDGAVGRVGVPQDEKIPAAQPTFFNNVTIVQDSQPIIIMRSGSQTHLVFYSGWPNAMTAITVAREVFQEK
jgi:hypothetical protein